MTKPSPNGKPDTLEQAQGLRLREERKRLGMTQGELAAKCRMQRASQQIYEKGARAPKLSHLRALAEVGADVIYIVSGSRLESAGMHPKEDWRIEQQAMQMVEECVSSLPSAELGAEARFILFDAFRKQLRSRVRNVAASQERENGERL